MISVGDRFETMATAVAASYMNIPVAHTMGGEISGTIDWIVGGRSGSIPFDKVRRLRISFRPSRWSHRFVTELWAEWLVKLQVVSTSWKSMFEQERFDNAYSGFIRMIAAL